VEETEHSVNFLRKVVPGATDRSYGVHVAKLAGIPASIIRRSFQILKTLEEKGKKDNQLQIFHDFSMDDNVLSENQNASDLPSEMKNNELPIFFNEMDIKLDEPDLLKEILADLRELEVDEMTPREALDLIFSWKEKTRRMKLDKKID
jgi:DNA mismatch repair protein MutS